MKINKYTALVNLILLYTFTTLSYTLWPISSPNRIVGFMIFFAQLWIFCGNASREKVVVLMMSISIVAISMLESSDISRNVTDCIYWLVTVWMLYSISTDDFIYEINVAIDKSVYIMKGIIVICNLLICAGFFDSRCYDTENWGARYYIGYTNAAHTVCAGVCLLMVLTLCVIKNEKASIFKFGYFIPSIVAILQSGARTYLIPVIIICIIYYLYFVKERSLKIVIVPLAIIIAIYAFMNSGMLDKFMFVSGNQYISTNASAQMTSGRTEFWMLDLWAFAQSDILHKILGNGFDYVYHINKTFYGLEIWAHNDIIDCLLSVGLAGTFIYIFVVYKMECTIAKSVEGFVMPVLLISYMLIPALVNGFFGYQHYLYSFVFLAVLFIERQRVCV